MNTTEQYQVLKAGAGDYDAVMQLYAELHAHDLPLPHERGQTVWQHILSADNLHLFLLWQQQQALASTYLNIIPNLTRGGAPYAVIENVVTAATHRGQGIGQLIMQHTLDAAWQAGCYKVMLLTGSSNPATHGFYRRCGFDGDTKHGYIARPADISAPPGESN